MDWTDFLNDPELNSGMQYYNPPDGEYLFGKIRHDVLECLSVFKGWTEIVALAKVELSAEILIWLAKWMPKVQTWIAEITSLSRHIGEFSRTSPEWPRLIAQVGQIITEVPFLESEIKSAVLPLSKDAMHMAKSFISVATHLNLIWHDIQAQEYKRLYTITQYGNLLNGESKRSNQ